MLPLSELDKLAAEHKRLKAKRAEIVSEIARLEGDVEEMQRQVAAAAVCAVLNGGGTPPGNDLAPEIAQKKARIELLERTVQPLKAVIDRMDDNLSGEIFRRRAVIGRVTKNEIDKARAESWAKLQSSLDSAERELGTRALGPLLERLAATWRGGLKGTVVNDPLQEEYERAERMESRGGSFADYTAVIEQYRGEFEEQEKNEVSGSMFQVSS